MLPATNTTARTSVKVELEIDVQPNKCLVIFWCITNLIFFDRSTRP